MLKVTQDMIDRVLNEKCAGYEIIAARVKGGEFSDSDCYGVALGRMESVYGIMFATWQWHIETEAEPVNFYWGHYHMENEAAARKDYEERT